MAASWAWILGLGLLSAYLARKAGLPNILGLLLTGIIIGPAMLDLLDAHTLSVSAELRQMALIVILLRAGMTLDASELKRIGRPAILLAFVPATAEMLAYGLLAPSLLGIDRMDALLMGAVLSAVSPAVVVPRMVRLMDEKWGTDEGVPQMIMAGASCDDVYVLVIFGVLMSMAHGGRFEALRLLNIPLAVVLGAGLGAATGFVLTVLLRRMTRGRTRTAATATVLLFAVALGLYAAEATLRPYVAVSGLLAVMTMGMVQRIRLGEGLRRRIGHMLDQVWFVGEIFLFVLVGAEVDPRVMWDTGPRALLLIVLTLGIRGLVVWLSTVGTSLNRRERLFTVIAYLPKATVQAAIGAVPLAAGLASGEVILSVAVWGILFTAPLGAWGIDLGYRKLLRPAAKRADRVSEIAQKG